ncbi:kinase-like domain-containing protein [Lactarius akahatsu]|uniref:Kinase-like domain-containing protein n=1 Tax=Lactarius akahatsu TaxID=416441 RepID=A0AAD4LDS8_9AGAM|nr:kinase-like domain-containing protein [Lactarius akahatsu]
MDGGSKSPRLAHLRDPSQLSPSPSPLRASFLDPGEEEQEPDASTESLYVTPPPSSPLVPAHRPAIAITTTNLEDTIASSSSLPAAASPQAEGVEDGDVPPSKAHSGSNPRYPAWLAAIVLPLAEFIDDAADPRAIFTDLQEIAEGESGSVYAAHAECVRVGKEGCEGAALVAIKRVPIPCDGSPKLTDLRGELELARSLRHANVLRMERLYVDVVEESLWIGMELMDRSLADVLGVVGEEAVDDSGPVAVSEKMIARFVWDVLLALSYIRKHHIAHRDVRSDNLLLSRAGVLKLSDFSNAVCSPPGTPKCSDHVGVVYWQAPEIRAGLYDPLKVDVWSLGATTWELAHGDPPFMDVEDTRLIVGHQLPPVREPETLSRSFHDFLHLCSQPVASRPDPDELLNAYFIRTACPRSEIVRLLGQCKAIDEQQLRRQSGDSDS